MFQFIFGLITSIPWAIEELFKLIGEGLYYGAGALVELFALNVIIVQLIAAGATMGIMELFGKIFG